MSTYMYARLAQALLIYTNFLLALHARARVHQPNPSPVLGPSPPRCEIQNATPNTQTAPHQS